MIENVVEPVEGDVQGNVQIKMVVSNGKVRKNKNSTLQIGAQRGTIFASEDVNVFKTSDRYKIYILCYNILLCKVSYFDTRASKIQ